MENGSIFVVAIFVLTYVGVAFGRVPGLGIDRTGIALLGAIAMVVSGAVSLDKAVEAVDLPTIILLYALMVLSAQLRLGGFYTWVGFRITALLARPRIFLAVMMATSAVLSAVLANDIICLAFTPVLALCLLNARLNPVPFLLGLAISSNIGSAATIIGNPQNMLIGQVGRLHFGQFLAWCAPPTVLALWVGYLLICWFYRKGFANYHPLPSFERDPRWPHLNRWQSVKGFSAAIILVALFFTSIPRELSAIAIAGILLCSRHMKSRQMLELVDWHLITLFCALFVVIQGLAAANVPTLIVGSLTAKGFELQNLFILTGVSTVMSNLVSNVPATMLLIRFLDPANSVQWYTLAVSSTFAGNLIVIGSIANLIVIEQAKSLGVEIGFREHARVGIPVTLSSLVILIGWICL
jgi:Na+/H+ antiporter NhaD/arsenite permease-like protein